MDKNCGEEPPRSLSLAEQAVRNWVRSAWQRLGIGVGLPVLTFAQARADDQVGFRHQIYREDDDRIQVITESALVQKILTPWLDLKVSAVYDAISGATPTGAPPPDKITLHPLGTGLTISGSSITAFKRAGSADAVSGASSAGSATVLSGSTVPLGMMKDIRRAIDATVGLTFGPHRIMPEFSYSGEIDYVSYSGALNYDYQFNEKNTTLHAGWSHSGDKILPNANTYITKEDHKDSDDALVGVTQLLGPKTVLDFNFTFGHGQGYFDDPYRGVIFEEELPINYTTLTIYPEKRPRSRDKEVAFLGVTQAITPLNASIEGSYRYYHDSFDIHGHTFGLAWYQKIGSYLILTPSLRYYRQTAANFYGTIFPGEPTADPGNVPTYYSADYRLSALESFSFGFKATVKVRQWLGLDLGYERYVMYGLDGITDASAYPSANVFTIGARIWF